MNLLVTGTDLVSGQPGQWWIADGQIVGGPLDEVAMIDGFVLPGLVDAHCHIGLGAQGGVDEATARTQAIADRDSGVLLIRDAGAPVDTHWMDADPQMPRIVRSGRHIARPKRYIRGFAVEIKPEELPDEVERQARSGDGWVKLVGDWIDRSVGDLAPLWPLDLAREAIERAHRLGARVTAHCFAEESVAQLVAAGIDCIEHGTGLSEEVIAQMASRGVALVPTMTNLEVFPSYAAAGQERFPRYARHMLALHQRRWATLGAAREAGVPIYAGTDSGGTLGHGRIAEEIALLARLGGTEFALGAASWRARTWLGHGSLEVGAGADLVVYPADPRKDIAVLAGPRAVILRGTVVHRG